jgi:hypothetical protein
MLGLLGKVDPYKKAETDKSGKPISDFVLSALDKKVQKAGVNGEIYKKEKEFFEKAMDEAYKRIVVGINSACWLTSLKFLYCFKF